jgi:hypothetical protein
MKIGVIQSYREQQPEWIAMCISSVKKWCESNHYTHIFVGDELFDFYRHNIDVPTIVKTDAARIELLQHKMVEHGFDVVVWVDADVFIWNPRLLLCVPERNNFTVCQEQWHMHTVLNQPVYEPRINNAFMAFHGEEGLSLLKKLNSHRLQFKPTDNWMLGPSMLTPLVRSGVIAPRIQRTVACFSPESFKLLRKNPALFVSSNHEATGCPLYAANLVHSKGVSDKEMLFTMHELLHQSDELSDMHIKPIHHDPSVKTRIFYSARNLRRTILSL